MKYSNIVFFVLFCSLLASCNNNKLEEKGFSVQDAEVADSSDHENIEGLNQDSIRFDTRPSDVLMTGISNVRLTTLYKVNLNKKNGTTFIGSNNQYFNDAEMTIGNNWNGNLMPGLTGVTGYNFVNISHYDIKNNQRKTFFEKPVLIKTLYYPAFLQDTLRYKAVSRNYFLVSVYDEDTNKDGYVNLRDLRRFYAFDANGTKLKQLISAEYSVYRSDYDAGNDFLFVFAKLDQNKNGQVDANEPIHIFWVDLKDPSRTGQQY